MRVRVKATAFCRRLGSTLSFEVKAEALLSRRQGSFVRYEDDMMGSCCKGRISDPELQVVTANDAWLWYGTCDYK